jgi:uncharacterized metal-binding protein/predicted Fe-Mo cluster-binding NifX family protein
VVAEIDKGELLSRRTLDVEVRDEDDLIERLRGLRADMLVCGGIRRELMSDLSSSGVEVINNVAGEVDHVIEVLCEGRLSAGYGLRGSSRIMLDPLVNAGGPVLHTSTVDCLACPSRACTRGDPCVGPFPRIHAPVLDSREKRLLEVGQEVSAESDPRLCRVAELIHFVLGMEVQKVGLAYCWELFREVEVLVAVLSRHFTVVPVCCRVGSGEETTDPAGETSACRPDLQAALLEEAGTEINVMAGLCIGCDLLFTERSHVPATTIFVRDRALAHNPMAALHTRYYRDQIESRGQHPASRTATFSSGAEDR